MEPQDQVVHPEAGTPQGGTVTPFTLAVGTAVGAISWVGALRGKRILHRIPEWWFHRLIEALLIAAGFLFLLRG